MFELSILTRVRGVLCDLPIQYSEEDAILVSPRAPQEGTRRTRTLEQQKQILHVTEVEDVRTLF